MLKIFYTFFCIAFCATAFAQTQIQDYDAYLCKRETELKAELEKTRWEREKRAADAAKVETEAVLKLQAEKIAQINKQRADAKAKLDLEYDLQIAALETQMKLKLTFKPVPPLPACPSQ